MNGYDKAPAVGIAAQRQLDDDVDAGFLKAADEHGCQGVLVIIQDQIRVFDDRVYVLNAYCEIVGMVLADVFQSFFCQLNVRIHALPISQRFFDLNDNILSQIEITSFDVQQDYTVI